MKKQPVFAYYRKSQESEDRQALSIPSQKQELAIAAEKLQLEIVGEYEESKSAKVPGRPIFNQMIKDIKERKIKYILVWNPDRISRNPVDSGQIIYYMDLGFIDGIITPAQTFTNTPNDKFLLNLLCSQAKLENDNRGINAKRGMKTKAEMGWYPAPAPVGYLNTPDREKGFKIIIKDPDRFSLVQQIFEELMKGKQAIEVYLLARDKWMLTSQKGTPLARSTFYHLIKNPFYCGRYEWTKNSGNWHEGKHEAMLTLDEFNLIQQKLGKKGQPIQRSHIHDFTGLMKCSCGYAITATKKTKYYEGTNRTANYTFYHCSQKSKGQCNQKSISQKDLEKQIQDLLNSVHVHQDFLDWAKKWLSVLHLNEANHQQTILNSQQKSLSQIETQLNRLLDLRINDQIDDSAFNLKKQQLLERKKLINEKLSDAGNNSDNWRVKIETALEFAHFATERFKTGTRDDKRQILLGIGTNFILDNKKIRIDLHNHFKALSEQEKWGEKYSDWIEPQEYTDLLAKNPDCVPANPIWLPGLDSNQQP